jgi:hypothetical protein
MIVGWLAAGGNMIVNNSTQPFKEAEGSRRIPVTLFGSPSVNIIPRLPGPSGPAGNEIRWLAVYDSETSGYPLIIFRANPQ